jgi:WD40 repeat protein
LVYGISNGSIVNVKKDKSQVNLLTQSVKGQGEYKKFIYNEKDLILMVGKNVLPFVYDLNKVVVSWRGKNVPNDYLDLQVPINDVDALFFNEKNIACANSDNKVRLYDVRGTKTKPYEDIHLKL